MAAKTDDRLGAWRLRPEAGSALAIAFVRWVALRLGRRVVGIVLWPVAAYFLLVRRQERRAIAEFLQQVLGRPPRTSELLAHFHRFARVASDRAYLLGGRPGIPFRVHGRPMLREIAAARRGCVVLSSHLGSFEATRVVSFEDPSVVVHVVVDRALNPNFTRNLEAIAPGMAQLVVDASLPPAAVVLRVAELLRDGHWVGVPADRRMPGTPGVDVEFLGRPCRLPRGPFALAAMFDVPVIMATGLYLDGAYELRFDRLQPVRTQARAERDAAVRELARQYAARLERYAVMAPGNWFNFFRFWEQRP